MKNIQVTLQKTKRRAGSILSAVALGMACSTLLIQPVMFVNQTGAHAQELALQELLPGPKKLTPELIDVSSSSLANTTDTALVRWNALKSGQQAATFEGYFEIFREVAKIESLEKVARLAGVNLQDRLAESVTRARNTLLQNGLTASSAGKAALRTLIKADPAVFQVDEFERLQVSFLLILDYLEDLESAELILALSTRFAQLGLTDLGAQTVSDFLPSYFDKMTDKADRLSLIEQAAAAAKSISRPAVLRALGEMISYSSTSEKATLAQAAFANLDPRYLQSIDAQDDPVMEETLRAWVHGVEINRQITVSVDEKTLANSASKSLNNVALELILSAHRFDEHYGELVGLIIANDISDGYPIRAYQKLTNLDVPAKIAFPLYVDLIAAFADDNYAHYVDEIAGKIIASLSADASLGDALNAVELFKDFEVVSDPRLFDELVQLLPGNDALGLETKLRRDIAMALSANPNEPVGAQKIDVSIQANPVLAAAAYLINGDLLAGGLQNSDGAGEDDIVLLTEVSQQLWSYDHHREILRTFIEGSSSANLRVAVALGATNNPAFHAGEQSGQAFCAAIKALLPSVTNQYAREMLSASIGDVDTSTIPSGEALVRYARYLAATGRFLDPALASNSQERQGILETLAIFGNIAVATDEYQRIADYQERVKTFKRLAIARADVLDRKGWLNNAIQPSGERPAAPTFSSAGMVTDGRIALRTSAEASLPQTTRPFMPNALVDTGLVTRAIPVPIERGIDNAMATIAKRGETRATRLVRFSSELFDGIYNLGVREYIFLNNKTSTPRILFVSQGIMTASELVSQIQARDSDAISYQDGIVTLHVPLAIAEGATLILSGNDIKEFRFNTDKGAFLVNSGNLYTENVIVASANEASGEPTYVNDGGENPRFRPFILSWSNSGTYSASTRFIALGYKGGRAYGLSLTAGPSDALANFLEMKPPTGHFIDNSMENLLYGFYTDAAENVVVVGNELVNGVTYGLDPHDWSYNLTMAYNTAYGTQDKHGIIISREVDDSFIIGNLSFENNGTGIMLDRSSYGTIVYANDASRNGGDGFSALETPCTLVDSNYFSNNERTGIKIRNSWDVHVRDNIVVGNTDAGLEAYIDNLRSAEASEFRNFKKDPFYPVTAFASIENEFSENGVGLSVRGASEGVFYNNRFFRQLPKYTAGDIKPLSLDIVSRSLERGVQVQATCVPRFKTTKNCSLVEDGVIFSQVAQSSDQNSAASPNYCTDVAGTPQAYWYNRNAAE